MQSGISASRERLKDQWQQAYLTAPIWQFWLRSRHLRRDCGWRADVILGRNRPLLPPDGIRGCGRGGADSPTKNRLTGRMVYRDRRVPSFHARSGCFLRIDYGGA